MIFIPTINDTVKYTNALITCILLALSLVLATNLCAKAPPISAIPDGLPAATAQQLAERAKKLTADQDRVLADIEVYNSKRKGVIKGSDLDRWLTTEATRLDLEKEKYTMAVKQFNSDVIEAVKIKQKIAHAIKQMNAPVIKQMNAHAKEILKWDTKKLARLDKALNDLIFDHVPESTEVEIIETWKGVLTRGHDADLARKASGGNGPVFPGAGTQSFNDCTIFALANATGRPYGVVAAEANKLMEKGAWRSDAERENTQNEIEKRGLNGGEVVILAETLGQAEVMPSTSFAKTLKEGRPVLIHVVPQSGNFNYGHQVVLTKTFQNGGETWYEMMDSNQDPQHRLYLNHKELDVILQENGVAYSAEPETTVKPLR